MTVGHIGRPILPIPKGSRVAKNPQREAYPSAQKVNLHLRSGTDFAPLLHHHPNEDTDGCGLQFNCCMSTHVEAPSGITTRQLRMSGMCRCCSHTSHCRCRGMMRNWETMTSVLPSTAESIRPSSFLLHSQAKPRNCLDARLNKATIIQSAFSNMWNMLPGHNFDLWGQLWAGR